MKNNKGTIITFVVVIIGIIGLLYTTTYVLIGMENKIHQSLKDREKAYYITESGLERGRALLMQGITDSFIIDNPFSEQYVEQHRLEVTITEISPDVFKITSIGTLKKTKRIMESQITKVQSNYIVQSWKEID